MDQLLNVLMEDAYFADTMTADILEEGTTWSSYKIALSSDARKVKNSYKEANSLYKQGKKI